MSVLYTLTALLFIYILNLLLNLLIEDIQTKNGNWRDFGEMPFHKKYGIMYL